MIVFLKKENTFSSPKKITILGNLEADKFAFNQETILDFGNQNGVVFSFAKAYESGEYIDEALLNEAQRKAQKAAVALLFFHSETAQIPLPQHQLIRSVQLLQTQLIVVMNAPNIKIMPWAKYAKMIVQIDDTSRWEELMKAIDF